MSTPLSANERAGSVSDGLFRRLRFRLVRSRLVLLLVLLGLAAGAGIVIRPHVRAWYHRRAARLAVQRYHNWQAIRHLLICGDIWPHDPESLLLSARVARRARVYGDSERLLRTYREVRGRDDAYTFEHLLLNAECQVDEFAVTCWKCVEEGRYDAALLMEALTRGYLRQYRYGQARLCLDHWKEVQPDNPQAFYLDGLFLLDHLHNMSTAAESYRRAVELDPDHEEARLGLAVALLMGKDYARALQEFQHLLQGQPDNVRIQVRVAECLDGLGESAKAEQLLDDVLARQPQQPEALSLRGQLALKSEHLAEAETFLRESLRYRPRDQRTIYTLIVCLDKSGKGEEARQQQQQLQELEKDITRFNDLVTKEILQKPNDPAVHFSIGQLLLRTGNRDDGLRWLQSALRNDPNYEPARQLAAEYLSQPKGKPPSAGAGR
jgi:predicted Zn-dependent protease